MGSRRTHVAWNRPQSPAEWVLFVVFGASFVTMIVQVVWWSVRF